MMIRMGILLGMLAFGISSSASAIVYKNPALQLDDDDNAIGFSVALSTMEFEAWGSGGESPVDVDFEMANSNFSLSIADGSAIGIHGGIHMISWPGTALVESEDMVGPMVGFSYRQNLIPDNNTLQMGYFLSIRRNWAISLDGNTLLHQFDGGFGFSWGIFKKFRLYGGGVYTLAKLEMSVYPGTKVKVENANKAGAFAGFEVQGTKTIVIGLEAHGGAERGAAFYMDFLL